MVDKSWGAAVSPGFRVRNNLTLDQRAAERAQARDLRAVEHSRLIAEQQKVKLASREAEKHGRELEREARREKDAQHAPADPHAAAAKRHRPSGRKDVVREQRDTRGYATVVDQQRIRELAKRGASVAGLAAAFGITSDEVEQAIAATR